MHETLLPMTISALAAHVANVELMYSDNKYHEFCGQMGHLIGPSGIGNDQLHDLVEAIMRSFRDHERQNTRNWRTRSARRTPKKSLALSRDKVGFSGRRRPSPICLERQRPVARRWRNGRTIFKGIIIIGHRRISITIDL